MGEHWVETGWGWIALPIIIWFLAETNVIGWLEGSWGRLPSIPLLIAIGILLILIWLGNKPKAK